MSASFILCGIGYITLHNLSMVHSIQTAKIPMIPRTEKPKLGIYSDISGNLISLMFQLSTSWLFFLSCPWPLGLGDFHGRLQLHHELPPFPAAASCLGVAAGSLWRAPWRQLWEMFVEKAGKTTGKYWKMDENSH